MTDTSFYITLQTSLTASRTQSLTGPVYVTEGIKLFGITHTHTILYEQKSILDIEHLDNRVQITEVLLHMKVVTKLSHLNTT